MYFLKLIIILLALFTAKIYYAYNATIYNESKPRLISLEVVLILPDHILFRSYASGNSTQVLGGISQIPFSVR